MRQLIAVALFCAAIVCFKQYADAQVPMTGAGLGAPSAPAGCSQATTFIARTSGLSANETTGYTNAICYWVNNSVFSKIDVAYVLATNTTTTAVLNLVSTSFSGSLTIGSGTFTADQGITGDGSSTLIDTTFVPSSSGGNYGGSINVGFLGAYVRTSDATGGNKEAIGSFSGGGANFADIRPLNSGNFQGAINATNGADTATNSNAQGNYVFYRTGASSTVIRKNEAALGTGTSTVSALPTSSICVFVAGTSNNCAVGSGFANYQVAAIIIGGGLTTTAQADAIAHGFNLYMTAVGTNVY